MKNKQKCELILSLSPISRQPPWQFGPTRCKFKIGIVLEPKEISSKLRLTQACQWPLLAMNHAHGFAHGFSDAVLA